MSREAREVSQQSQRLEDDQSVSAAAGSPFIPPMSWGLVVPRPLVNTAIKGLNGLPDDFIEYQFCGVLNKPGYLDDSDIFTLGGVSKITQSLFQPNRLQMLVEKLLVQAIRGQQKNAEVILKNRLDLLLIKGTATDYQGRTIIATSFQAALATGDKPMWEMMLPHLEAIKPGEALRQFQEWFPEGSEEDEIPADALKDYYNELARAIIHDADDGQAAIERFREYISYHKEIRQGKIFSLQHLIAAYAAYIDNLGALGTWPKLDLFWNQVIGYVQRQMNAYDAQVHCSGVDSVLKDPAKFKRSLKFYNNDDEFLPCPVNSGLGFDRGAYSYIPGVAGAALGSRAGRVDYEWRLLKRLCRTKTDALVELRKSLEPRVAYQP